MTLFHSTLDYPAHVGHPEHRLRFESLERPGVTDVVLNGHDLVGVHLDLDGDRSVSVRVYTADGRIATAVEGLQGFDDADPRHLARVARPRPAPGSAEAFLSGLPWTVPIQWYGTQGTLALDDDRRVVLTPSDVLTNGIRHCGSYYGIQIKVVSKTAGRVVGHALRFDDHLDHDDVEPHPNLHHDPGFHVWTQHGWDWYIRRPRDARPFTRAVEAWIGEWA